MRSCFRKACLRPCRPVSHQRGFSSSRVASELNTNSSLLENSVVFSGIQPTGVPHLGNYLGALQPWVQLQNSAPSSTKLIFSLVDLHAITSRPEAAKLQRWKTEALASLLAVGIDPERSTIFFQSEVPAHAELMWALSCDASIGYLNRMTQWKSKLSVPDSASIDDQGVRGRLRLGLFSYPVLQAADILVHRATHVPVGEDQKQHLEFARDCAQGFNSAYGSILVPPKDIISPFKRVMSLEDPMRKMSKSIGDERSRILLTDDDEAIRAKLMRSLTDSYSGISYDPVNRPGVANLIDIVSHLEGDSPSEICERYANASLKVLKEDTAKTITKTMSPIRERLRYLLDPGRKSYLDEISTLGREQAVASSEPVIASVYEAMGLSRNRGAS